MVIWFAGSSLLRPPITTSGIPNSQASECAFAFPASATGLSAFASVARKLLAEVALDGLPRRVAAKIAPILSDYADEFWTDYSSHWKPSTQKRNQSALKLDILPVFGSMRLDLIGRAEITRWRDSYANGRESKYNRAVPVLGAMFKYAEQLGYTRKGYNPCRGMPGFKPIKKERFLSPQEFRRIARQLDAEEPERPIHVAIVRLLIFTG